MEITTDGVTIHEEMLAGNECDKLKIEQNGARWGSNEFSSDLQQADDDDDDVLSWLSS